MNEINFDVGWQQIFVPTFVKVTYGQIYHSRQPRLTVAKFLVFEEAQII